MRMILGIQFVAIAFLAGIYAGLVGADFEIIYHLHQPVLIYSALVVAGINLGLIPAIISLTRR